MNKRLNNIEKITKDGKEYLRFKYVDDLFEDFEIHTETGTKERFTDKGFLVESQPQLERRFKTGDFENCIFLIGINFSEKWKRPLRVNFNFYHSIFTQDVNFDAIVFNEEVTFMGAVFIKKANFIGTKFNKMLNFSGVKVRNLNLQNTIIDSIEYSNVRFNANNRETFLTLKNLALKQNDQIKALEFHQQEYQTHLKTLRKNKTNKNLSDRFILTFESWASTFGTNVIRSIMRFIGVIMLFYVLINGFNYDARTITDFASPLSYDIDVIFACVSNTNRYLFFFYKILQVVLIYEIIKSFRKFSRQL